MSEDLETKLKEFEDWMLDSQNPHYANSTIADTLRHLRNLAKDCDIFSRDSILEFLREKKRQGASKKYINEKVKYLNRWLPYRREDRFEYIQTGRRKFTVNRFDDSEIKALIEGTKGQVHEDWTDHAMVVLALNTGLRAGEIANLRIADIHEDWLRVLNGKGEKDRDVLIQEYPMRALREYLVRRDHPECEYVFTTRKGKVSVNYMERIARRIRQRTGVKSFKWQKCRHTYAKNLIDNKIDLLVVSQMMGHNDPRTTLIYTGIDTDFALGYMRERKPREFRGDTVSESCKSSDTPYGLAGI